MRIHYLQHVPFENPGYILSWAEKNGHTVTGTQLYQGDVLPNPGNFDWLVIMGGPMNIYEEEKYPWLTTEKAFILRAIHEQKVLIGLCLGAQLIADVLGGKVTRNPYSEIGWFPVRFCNEATENELFSFLPPEPVVFEWHGDTFSSLPQGAVCIADNQACRHQAFVWHNRVFGFQFHLENTLPIIQDLIQNCGDEMGQDTYVQSADEILSHPEYIAQDNVWMDTFLTRLEKKFAEGSL